MAIDRAAGKAIKSGAHAPSELYLDSTVFLSLRFRSGFDRAGRPRYRYESRLSREESYVCMGVDEVLSALDRNPLPS